MKNTALLIVLFLAAGAAQAQTAGTVTLTANATSATGSMVPRPDLVHQPRGHQLHRKWRLVGHQGGLGHPDAREHQRQH